MTRKPDLTQKQADEIRARAANGWTLRALAERFGVNRGTIKAVIERRGPYRPQPSNPGEKR